MKITTVPFLPFSDASECDAPSVSGKVKSSIIDPTAGGAGRSDAFRPLPAIAAIATIKTAPRNKGSAYFFILLLLSELAGVTAKIISVQGAWQVAVGPRIILDAQLST